MKSTHKNLAVIAETAMPDDCLDLAGAVMRVPAFARIDQTTRNGP